MHEKLRVLDLFSGIGGFALGLKRAGGFQTVAYCEIDGYCQRLLQARMRDGSLDTAPICRDIRWLDGKPLQGLVDLVCGGFPCQDISDAGKRQGIEGQRSGLWKEMARIIREIRPRYVFVENVAALLVRGMGTVLGDLAEIGYDAEWEVISAASVGAPHLRERVWIVAYPKSERVEGRDVSIRRRQSRPSQGNADGGCKDVSDPERWRLQGRVFQCAKSPAIESAEDCGDSRGDSLWSTWEPEPQVGRLADGIPNLVDQLRGLGNAVVPQVVEWIGKRIMKDVS